MLKKLFKSDLEENSLKRPIRDEIFSPERLEQYAEFLATKLSITKKKTKGKSLLPGVKDNEKSLKNVYNEVITFVAEDIRVSPAGEWIIDNYHIIEDQVREIKEDLPGNYYKELPKINSGELKGYPRVYAIALTLVAHLDSRMDIQTIVRFVNSYQKFTPLLIGEIWAIPIVLRIALLENLRRLADQAVFCQRMKNRTDLLADDHLKGKSPSFDELKVFTDQLSLLLGKSEECDCSVISQLSERLHTRSPEIISALEYIDEYLAGRSLEIEEVVRVEHQMQTMTQVSVSNAITSMKLLSNTDWQEFFESLSHVEKVLGGDPQDTYKKMTFQSRDEYRNAIERIQKKTGVEEVLIAKEAVIMATNARMENNKNKQKHCVGYYLIRRGVFKLEEKLGYKPSPTEYLKRFVFKRAQFFYFSSLFLITLILITPLMFYLFTLKAQTFWFYLVAFVALIPAMDSALNILNLIITYLVTPNTLPKINLENGVPDEAKTFVVVPVILGSQSEANKVLEDLEIRFLTNSDANLYFGVLSDFKDSNLEFDKSDEAIVGLLKNGVDTLNIKYGKNETRFFLFHRKRIWNESEKKWMGWERKRGKIHEFNRFLRNKGETSFSICPSYNYFFSKIKYVITLDADTKLPRDSARKLVGTILHPLNAPIYDEESQKVVKGYSILQPRISITPEGSERSHFAQIYSGYIGIDPYTTAVSDTYQDLFGEGIYTGKGLYVVDTFEKSLENRVPDNQLLSHDLFEGVFARAALVSDIEFLDDYPAQYEAFSKRNHRWVRGDWQIIKWIFSRIPNAKGEWVKSPLSFISRWKIFDNLRRSLVPLTTLIWFLLSWSLLPGHAIVWTLIILTVLTLPFYAHTGSQILKYPHHLSLWEHTLGIYQDIKLNLFQLGISVITLPHQSFLHTDAILRTLYRVFISKKNLLEWTTAAHVDLTLKNGSSFTSRALKYSVQFSCTLFLILWFIRPSSLAVAGVFLVGWCIFPLILERLSRIIRKEKYKLMVSEEKVLRSISRRTWNFFETFVSKKTNWLPPDNFQEDPGSLIAERTSPTNLGLYLLSVCSAYNFGYITQEDLVTRLENTLATMNLLDRQYGHFYNWYDTDTLIPLNPEYISTVDSGNLAGHLLAVKQTCLSLKSRPLTIKKQIRGLEDILFIIEEESLKLGGTLRKHSTFHFGDLTTLVDDCLHCFSESFELAQDEFFILLENIESRLKLILEQLNKLSAEHGEAHYHSLRLWVGKGLQRVKVTLNEINNNEDREARKLIGLKCEAIANQCHDFFIQMDFSLLFDNKRKLFTIGRNIRDGKSDESFYDLLASEARLTSFLSIAKGDVPESHWFHLGRQMTSLYRERVLISWSASMFEYLMPLLVMKDYEGTLLHETHTSVIKQQITYAHLRKLPWGLSESAYNARDLQMNYQYGPFGVPGMGLKRGLSQDYVVSPYSTALAAMVDTQSSLKNFRSLIKSNFLTDYGFYEAIDYTEERVPSKKDYAIVKNFMAHHQGMTLVALDNLLHENGVRKKFHQDPMIKSTELLLQEKIPKRISISHPRAEEVNIKSRGNYQAQPRLEMIDVVNTTFPKVRVLSNGNYTVMVTATGSGFSHCENESIFRWQNDLVLENEGQFFFLIEDATKPLSSLTFSPLHINAEKYKTCFSGHKAEFWYENDEVLTHNEVVVSSEDNVELRRITLRNLTNETKKLELVSYAEPVLSSIDDDISHPVFNKLFLETSYIAEKTALIVKRRKRSPTDDEIFGIHQINYDPKVCKNLSFETDRLKFFGRRNKWDTSNALKKGERLTNSLGCVLDPIQSFKIEVILKPLESTQMLFVSGVAKSHSECLRLLDQYHDLHIYDREDRMSWTQNQVELRHLNLELDEVSTFQKLCGALLFSVSGLRALPYVIESNQKGQKDLWHYGISGDLPICLINIKNKHHMSFILDILQLHEYLRGKNIKFDLVILSEETSSYRMAIHNEILHQLRIFGAQSLINKKGGIFLLRRDLVPDEDVTLIMASAHIIFNAHLGSLKKQVDHLLIYNEVLEIGKQRAGYYSRHAESPLVKPELDFFNGYGGFYNEGREYQIFLKPGVVTPAPWINVISNSIGFGFIVSESGSSYTWSLNSRENRITPWSNDPVHDPSGEIIYLLDRDSLDCWTPTPAPVKSDAPFLIKHGQGYTTFVHNSHGVSQELTLFVSMDKEVKYFKLKLKNLTKTNRKLSAFLYLELVLGFHRMKTAHHIVTKVKGNVLTSYNPFSLDFGNRTSFASSNKKISSFTCDRLNFIGRYNDYGNPAGIFDSKLNGKTGGRLDPCFALKVDCDLDVGGQDEIIFVLGQYGPEVIEAKTINSLVTKESVQHELTQAIDFWDKTLNCLRIKTSKPEFDILINRWMPYQTLSSRIWGRTAFYQSGGAYGFRDQLQDVTSLLFSSPELARDHIIKAASHQFAEGDVLHWWHPPLSKGVRTHFSDDRIWLPYVVNEYIEATGDRGILDERISFVEGEELKEGQDDLYLQVTRSEKKLPLYDHCIAALDISLKVGRNGLPLIGTGDWNDGMNMIGHKGEGESIWLAWFLGATLNSFKNICEERGDKEKSIIYTNHLRRLIEKVEENGWDGKWYKRAFFDDGTPIGTNDSLECRIDSIAQSWSILSDLGDKEHIKSALLSVKEILIDRENKLVNLFLPPFDKTNLEPGYIKGYPPGIRENGGQYTHAAIWLAMAFAKAGDADQSLEILGYINPISRTLNKEDADKYKAEPYVVVADIYSHPMHIGRAGWSWYTGSSCWFYRSFLESLLGINIKKGHLTVRPNFPNGLNEYKAEITIGESLYILEVKASDENRILLDGELIKVENKGVPLLDDKSTHSLKLFIQT